ncbi:putative ARM repeat-containing protein [Lyophyllum shimeji]|uniref:ARM repeat-containing protein n=1 Tax=Lyophyllum shimeji TaxID=47721 RepID=A0A9P3PNU8_LYOSH|nr:putative ARM repeat-containing protein [Lyophyllum shimeji]
MDLQTLSNLFATTISPDPNVRKAAELQIRKVGNEEGMVTALLQIIAADSIDLSTRQACSVWLKNRVHSLYALDASTTRRPDQGVIAPSDREALRAHILPLLAASPSRSVTLQLANTLKSIVAHDFPERWPGLLDEIKRLLSSSNIREVHAGCVAVLEAVRAFRFRPKSTDMPRIVAEVFPILVNIATQMLQTPPSAALEIPTMLHLILKTYRTSIVVDLSVHQQNKDSLVPWGQLLFAVVNLQIPKDAVPEDEDERERSEWWKAKKWAYAILGRLFHRFGNPSQLPSAMKDQYGVFAQHFVTNFAPEILSTYLNQVQLFVSNQTWLSKKCQYQIFQFFTECIKPKSTWVLLKPSFETLVSSFVFPHLSFNETKKALWEGDPVDYVRISVDEYESFATPVSAATSFLFSLASNRTKTTFMPILGFINTVLRSNSPAPQRFGALNMTAALAPWMMRHPDVRGNMEAFVLQFVTPEFTSSEPYLRAIACEVIGTVTKAGLTWSSEENLNANFRAVAAALDDPEFPVRVNAALALTELVLAHESVRTAVGPQVGKVIQDLLKLSDDTDLDILNHSMEVMVDAFQTELLPVAAQLTARLCESYLRLAKESLAQEETDSQNVDLDNLMSSVDEDKTFAAMGVAKTISTIVSSVESSREILGQVQEVIIPIIHFTLENKLLDLFDNMYDLVDSLTFKLRSIAPGMWPIFELTYKLFKSDAVDFLDEMLPSLDNIVSYGGDVIKTRPDYKQMLVDIYTTSITNDQLGENDRVNGSKLAESILLNLRGSVDDYLQIIIATALDQVDKAQTTSFRLANLEVLINAVLYNPSAALQLMEAVRPGMARAFFDRWFAAITGEKQLPRVHDKKLSILALCALLELAPGAIPEPLQSGWPGIVGGILTIFKDLPQAIADRKELEEALQEDSDDDELIEEKILNFNEDEEDVWDEDSAYLEMLANEGARLREKQERAAVSGEEDSDSEDEEIEEELGYISPLDTVDPYVSFKQALTTFQAQNGPAYQAATTALTVEQQTLLMEVMRTAELQSGAAVQA